MNCSKTFLLNDHGHLFLDDLLLAYVFTYDLS